MNYHDIHNISTHIHVHVMYVCIVSYRIVLYIIATCCNSIQCHVMVWYGVYIFIYVSDKYLLKMECPRCRFASMNFALLSDESFVSVLSRQK